MITKRLFVLFRYCARAFSGSGLRDRFDFIDAAYKSINRFLSPEIAIVFGHKIYLDRGDSMGLAVHGNYEPIETQLVMDNINPGQIVLDIGANIGYYTLLFAKLVGSSGKVFAFEPEAESFKLLTKNVQENQYGNVKLEQKAVSNHQGMINLSLDPFSNLDHRIFPVKNSHQSVQINVIRLDDYFSSLESVDFIKMDIQGAEGLALDGMQELIGRSRKLKILTEFWPNGLEASGIDSELYLRKLSAMGFCIYDVGQHPILTQRLSVSRILDVYMPQPQNHTNLLCMRDN